MQTQSTRERNRWLGVVLGFVAVEATAFSLRGALVPRFVEVFDTTARLAGLIAPAATVSFVVTLLLTGLAATGQDARRLLATATAATGLCFLGAALAPSFVVLLVVLFGRGVATGVFRGLDRPLLSTLYEGSLERVFNYYDLAWAAGAALAPGIGVLAVGTVGWRWVYAVLGGCCFGLTTLAYSGRLGIDERRRSGVDRADLRRLASSGRIRWIAVAMFALGGVEGGLFTWLPLYVTRSGPSVSGATALTTLVVAYVPGRLGHAALSSRFDTARYLVAIAGGATLCLICTLAAPGALIFLAGVAVTGFLLAGVFPTAIALAVGVAPEQARPLNAGLTAVGYPGIAVWAPLAGHVSHVSGLSLLTVPAVLAVSLVGTLGYVVATDRRLLVVERGEHSTADR